MTMKTKHPSFGEMAEGYTVPVLNEREIRAAAGIMFLALLIAWMLVIFREDFVFVKYLILIFFSDFFVRIYISPGYAPLLIIGRLVVRGQIPEYVNARPKKFAWTIGMALSALMFILLVVLNSYSLFTGISCLLCLVFLFFESAFGICLGCWVYRFFHPPELLLCPGQMCERPKKQPIQMTSLFQILMIVVSTTFILLVFYIFNDYFSIPPRHLREIIHWR